MALLFLTATLSNQSFPFALPSSHSSSVEENPAASFSVEENPSDTLPQFKKTQQSLFSAPWMGSSLPYSNFVKSEIPVCSPPSASFSVQENPAVTLLIGQDAEDEDLSGQTL